MAFDIFQISFLMWVFCHFKAKSSRPINYSSRMHVFNFIQPYFLSTESTNFFWILFSYRDKAAANSLEFVYSSELKVGVLYYNLIIQHWHYFKLKNNRYSSCGLKAKRLFKSFQCLTLKWNHRMTPASCSPFLQTELSLYNPTCTCKIPSRIGAPYLQYLSCGSGSS